jgi:hypothetical protein
VTGSADTHRMLIVVGLVMVAAGVTLIVQGLRRRTVYR